MRITIDVSVIGLARLYETARTGIFRVISSLVPELLRHPDADLAVTAMSSTRVNRLTRAFFAEQGTADRYVGDIGLEERLFDLAAGLGALDRKKIAERLVGRIFRNARVKRIGGRTDIFHSTFAALPGYPGPVMSFLSIYDMIPVLHPEYFWQGFDEEFRAILASVRPDRDYVLTISQSSKRDICGYLKMPEDRVFVAYPAAASALYHPERDRTRCSRVLERYGIAGPGYVLTLATLEHRKNLQATIGAYRRLAAERKDAGPLVLVGTRGWKVDALLGDLHRDRDLRDRVVLTGYVRDEDLSSLYSSASMFVYPSLYEGFGLPPLEAMCCGVPVITSNTSSLPEVVGDAAIMVAPDDLDALTQAMLDLQDDADLRQDLAAKGLVQAQRFSWSACAQDTMTAYRRAWDGRG